MNNITKLLNESIFSSFNNSVNNLISNRYSIENKIGKGSFSKIYKAYDNKLKCHVAIKRIKIKNKYKFLIDNEIDILKSLDHPNVIKLLDVHYSDNNVYLITDYHSRGDLTNFIHLDPSTNTNISISFDTLKLLVKQFIDGMYYLYSKNIIHRDLKPHNILLSDNGILKICDFGFSSFYNDVDTEFTTLCGSPIYMAPEILFYRKYNYKADLWSMGLLIFHISFGFIPYKSNDLIGLQEEMKKIKEDGLNLPNIKIFNDSGLVDLIKKLLIFNQSKRLSFENLINHKFLLNTKNNETPFIKNYDPSLTSNLINSNSNSDFVLLNKFHNYKNNKSITTSISDEDIDLIKLIETTEFVQLLINIIYYEKYDIDLDFQEKLCIYSYILNLLNDIKKLISINSYTLEVVKSKKLELYSIISNIWLITTEILNNNESVVYTPHLNFVNLIKILIKFFSKNGIIFDLDNDKINAKLYYKNSLTLLNNIELNDDFIFIKNYINNKLKLL